MEKGCKGNKEKYKLACRKYTKTVLEKEEKRGHSKFDKASVRPSARAFWRRTLRVSRDRLPPRFLCYPEGLTWAGPLGCEQMQPRIHKYIKQQLLGDPKKKKKQR